jgi:hypothetical protein
MAITGYLETPPEARTLEQWRENTEDCLVYISKQTKYWEGRTGELQSQLEKIRVLIHCNSEFKIVTDLEKLLDDKLGDKQKLKHRVKELESENTTLRAAFEALKGGAHEERD